MKILIVFVPDSSDIYGIFASMKVWKKHYKSDVDKDTDFEEFVTESATLITQ